MFISYPKPIQFLLKNQKCLNYASKIIHQAHKKNKQNSFLKEVNLLHLLQLICHLNNIFNDSIQNAMFCYFVLFPYILKLIDIEIFRSL